MLITAFALLFVLLLVFIGADRHAQKRRRKRFEAAAAEEPNVEVAQPIQASTYDVRCEGVKPPWFTLRGRILDDDTIVIRDWGKN